MKSFVSSMTFVVISLFAIIQAVPLYARTVPGSLWLGIERFGRLPAIDRSLWCNDNFAVTIAACLTTTTCTELALDELRDILHPSPEPNPIES